MPSALGFGACLISSLLSISTKMSGSETAIKNLRENLVGKDGHIGNTRNSVTSEGKKNK